MKNKAILIFVLAILIASPIALAQEIGDETVTDDTVVDDVTTDDPSGDDISDDETDSEDGTVVEDTTSDEGTEDTTGTETQEETEEDTTEEETDEVIEVSDEVTQEAGITPDSPLYGLERAMERISLALTFGKAAKAKKGLAHAHERLMEVQAMIAAKKLGAAAVAQEEHDSIMEGVEEDIQELGNEDLGGELTDELEIEDALEEHEAAVQQVNQIRTKVKGTLTEQQQTQLNAMVTALEGATTKARIEVQARKNKTKIKIKAAAGLTDEQLVQLETQAQEIVGNGGKVKLQTKKAKEAKVGSDDSENEAEESGSETEDTQDSEDTEDEAQTNTPKVKVTKSNNGKNK